MHMPREYQSLTQDSVLLLRRLILYRQLHLHLQVTSVVLMNNVKYLSFVSSRLITVLVNEDSVNVFLVLTLRCVMIYMILSGK